MEIKLLTVESSKEPWAEAATQLYSEKIGHHVKFVSTVLKSKKIDRDDKDKKKEQETEMILKAISEKDFVILCDEKGKEFESVGFSKKIINIFESGGRTIVFVIGGAFGVDDALKKRANLTMTLSKMTMNHLVARVQLLEQIYRALMIWKGRPYHNE